MLAASKSPARFGPLLDDDNTSGLFYRSGENFNLPGHPRNILSMTLDLRTVAREDHLRP